MAGVPTSRVVRDHATGDDTLLHQQLLVDPNLRWSLSDGAKSGAFGSPVI